MARKPLDYILYPAIALILAASLYIGLFHNDAQVNFDLIKGVVGSTGVIIINILLLGLVIPVSLSLMDIITGKEGLERFKKIVAISIGMTALSFAVLQFINALATSSAEGATVIVEVVQQMAHLSHTGTMEEYGLVGMLTSNASGPWNSSIFPLIIFIVWFIRKKDVYIEAKQLHIPFAIQFMLYAQQFLFALDHRYTLLEILLMVFTGTAFVIGMLSFMIPMFKKSHEYEDKALQVAKSYTKVEEDEGGWYKRTITYLATIAFSITTFNPWNKRAKRSESKVHNGQGGFGSIPKSYVALNAIQLTVAITVAMFILVLATQFFAVQIKMSDAEAALFGTAGLTSAPEALVALGAGPYVNTLLLVGSNIVDGWMSAIGQAVLLIHAEIVTDGALNAIPLHPSIAHFTFLSWTQGILVWGILYLFIRYKGRTDMRKLALATIAALAGAILYYFGGAWYTAQALGYGAEYALNNPVYLAITAAVNLFAAIGGQQIGLILSALAILLGLIHRAGILDRLQDRKSKEPFPGYRKELDRLTDRFQILEDQHVVILLDKSSSMNEIHLFDDNWIDLAFTNVADLALILDEDAHVHVYTTAEDDVELLPYLLTYRNKSAFIERYVHGKTEGDVYYAPAMREIFDEHRGSLKSHHNPVVIICLTDGDGVDLEEFSKVLQDMSAHPIYVHFVLLFANEVPKSAKRLQDLADRSERDNFAYTLLPSYQFSDREYLKLTLLESYERYLQHFHRDVEQQ